MRIGQYFVRFILILCLPVLFLSASIAWGFNSAWIYELGFNKYHVSQKTGISSPELAKAARGMIAYFNSPAEYPQITVIQGGRSINLFTEEEQVHLRDVKQLVWLDYRILLVTALLVIGALLQAVLRRQTTYRRWLAKTFLWGCGLSLLIILIMGVATLVDFDQLFLQFHFLAFSNSFWSAPGYMIALFGDLWYDAVLIAIGFMAGLAILSGLIALVYLRLTRETNKLKPNILERVK